MSKCVNRGLAALLFCLPQSVLATVSSISVQKVASHTQEAADQAPLDDSFEYALSLQATGAGEVGSVLVSFGELADAIPLTTFGGSIWSAGGSVRSQEELEAIVPLGIATFEIDGGTLGAASATLDISSQLLSSQVPQFSPETYANLQGMDPSVDFTVMFNGFTPSAGQALTTIVYINNAEPADGGQIVAPNPAATSIVIPAGTLSPGTDYSLLLLFQQSIITPLTVPGPFFGAFGFHQGLRSTWMTFQTMSNPGDCNNNGIPDESEIAAGSAHDGDENGVPDVCETVVVPAGDDCFFTPCEASSFSFEEHPIPAGFFGSGSLEFAGTIMLGNASADEPDTTVTRLGEMALAPPPSSDSTAIQLAELALVSCEPTIVEFCCGPAQEWDVLVGLSSNGPPPPPGQITVHRTHENGGTFQSSFNVQPVFTFVRRSDGVERVLDTGAAGLAPLVLGTSADVPYVHDLKPGSGTQLCGERFAPGVVEVRDESLRGQGFPQCCERLCHSGGLLHAHCTNPPSCPLCQGACCMAQAGGGVCAELTRDECSRLGGEYHVLQRCFEDGDSDGIADVFEGGDCCDPDACNSGTNPANPDTDGDGFLDGADPDPCDACVPDGSGPECSGPIDCNNNDVPDSCERGACCVTSTECATTTKEVCNAAGGTFYGPCVECPSQNAVVIVEPGGEVFVHVIEPPVDCPGGRLRGGGCVEKEVMIDPWESPADGSMCHAFGVENSPAIPADFFAPGSAPFIGSLCLAGVPLGMTEYGTYGDADTLIARAADPFSRCDLPSASPASVDIEIVALSMASVEPILVLVNGVPELWDARVDLSEVRPPAGQLTATKTYCNGGTYTSTIRVQPRFTFTKVGDPGQERVLDTGMEGIPPVTLVQDVPAPWVSVIDPNLGIASDDCTDFHPGIEDQQPEEVCDCNENGVADVCDLCGDLDEDGDVDSDDYDLFVGAFGRTQADTGYMSCADYDHSGAVGLADYGAWLRCYHAYDAPPPEAGSPAQELIDPSLVRPEPPKAHGPMKGMTKSKPERAGR